MQPYIGTIMLFAFPRVPYGWAFCDGSLLSISEYESLFAVIGTTYGGDGISTFALPDLRGRVPVHQGHGPGLASTRVLGERAGSETVTLTAQTMPAHPHQIMASSTTPPVGATATPGPTVAFGTGVGLLPYAASVSGMAAEVMDGTTITWSGEGQPHENMMPTVVASYCIALVGLYPSQG